MEDEVDAFDFVLAEALGMSLEDEGRLSNAEVNRWRAFYEYRAAMAEHAGQARA